MARTLFRSPVMDRCQSSLEGNTTAIATRFGPSSPAPLRTVRTTLCLSADQARQHNRAYRAFPFLNWVSPFRLLESVDCRNNARADEIVQGRPQIVPASPISRGIQGRARLVYTRTRTSYKLEEMNKTRVTF